MSPPTTHLTLPSPRPCPLCQWTPPHQHPHHHDQATLTKAMRTHLRTTHPNADLNALPPPFLSAYHLHHCTTCKIPKFLYLRSSYLAHHCKTCHDPHRDTLNTDLITTTLPALSPSHTHQWQTALQWLHQLTLNPTPFRTTLRRHLSAQSHKLLHTHFHHVTQWVISATKPFRPNNNQPTWQTTSDGFWKLLFIFEALILHPHDTLRQPTLSDTITHRCLLFRQGHLQQLYTAAFTVPTDPPHHPTPIQPQRLTDAKIQHSAQMAINQDNLHAATARLFSANPQAALTATAITHIQSLYPPRRRTPAPPTTPYATRSTTQHSTSQNQQPTQQTYKIEHDAMHQALQHLRRGTATGPYGDSTDFIRAYALHTRRQPNGTFSFPYLATFRKLLNLIVNANMPRDAQHAFTTNYFMAIHKSLAQPDKLRPIGIGTALRRIAGAAIMRHHRHQLAAHFLPHGQFGIGIKGGIDLVIQATSTDVHRYITSPAQPTHALLSLDIKNMFNEVSRDATLTALQNTPSLHNLIPYYRLLYDVPNRCWYKPPSTSHFQFFNQHEGHAQGDPLSGAFSALPLASLLATIRPQLLQRQQNRHTLSNSQAPLHAPRSYMDDTSVLLHHHDVAWFFHQFQTKGPAYGIYVNRAKTKLLTATDHREPYDVQTTNNPQSPIHAALKLLAPAPTDTSPEITTGLRFLGAPIGSPAFCHNFLLQAATQFQQRTDRLIRLVPDAQSCSAVFRSCLQPSLAHLFFTDLITPTPNTGTPYHHDPHLWQSAFIDHIMATTTHFLRRIAHQAQPLPTTSLILAFHPAATGGAGYRDLAASAIPQTVVSIHRSLTYANHGYPLPNGPPIQIPSSYTSSLSPPLPSGTHPQLPPLFQFYDSYQSLLPSPTQLPPPRFTQQLYQEYQTQYLQSQLPLLPTTTLIALPSLLSPLTSLPLHSLPRYIPTNRIPSDHWRLLLQRKLRLPLSTSLPSTCPCGKAMDSFGDHFFACRKYHKTPLSNSIRNAFHTILHTLGPLANFCRNHSDVQCEPTAILPHHPTKRPADIGFPPLSPASPSDPSITTRYVAIDITIPPAPASLPVTLSSQLPSPHPLHVAHDQSIRKKFIGRTSQVDAALLIADLNANDVSLLPFTIDHLGGFGHFAHSFLFGPTPPPPFAPPPPKPPWTTPNDFPHSPAFFAYQRALHTPNSLLDRASRQWRIQTKHQVFHNPLRSTTSPSRWALQSLSLNISLALATHISKALTSLNPTHFPPPLPGPTFHHAFSSLPPPFP